MSEIYNVTDSEDDEILLEFDSSQSQKWQAISVSSSSSDDELPRVTFEPRTKPYLNYNEKEPHFSTSTPPKETATFPQSSSSIVNNDFTQIKPKSPRKRKAASLESREEKAAKKAREKAIKNAEKANREAMKPGECLKNITTCVDPRLLDSLENTGELLSQLQTCGVSYQIESQPVPLCVQWRRETTKYYVDDDSKVCCERNVTEEPEALTVVPAKDFAATSILSLYKNLREKLKNRRITLVIYGLEQFLRQQKTKDSRKFREKVRENRGEKEVFFDRKSFESAKVDLLLQYGCSVWSAENSQELSQIVAQFTKSVAEKPFKEASYKQHFNFYAQEFCVGSVKVTKEGIGFSKLWQQQLQQFPLAGLETAQAIAAVYPSPLSIIRAYKNCTSSEQASLLLQDIQVRRGAGVLSTSRRIGPELSKKIHKFMTSKNGDDVL